MQQNALILFTGNARREEARKGLPPRFLSVLHRELVATARALDGVDLLVASEGAQGFRIAGPLFTIASESTSLGGKIEDAVVHAFAFGYRRVLVVAGDVPGLTREVLSGAFEALQRNDAVIGRSPDGGFYLAGFRKLPRIAWASLPWCTEQVFDALVAAIQKNRMRLAQLDDLGDIDSRADAVRALNAMRARELRARCRVLLSMLAMQTPVESEPAATASRRVSPDQLRAPPAAA